MSDEVGVKVVTSQLLPVPHGFFTRRGGVSAGPFSSLNVAANVGDGPDAVAENLRRVADHLGLSSGHLRTVNQVHQDKVLQVRQDTASEGTAADALWTDEEGLAVGVRTADCVPILLADARGRVAAVHSGWKGTALGVVARAVDALAAAGARPETLVAAIGPSIRACCYEVSEELADRFRRLFPEGVVIEEDGGLHLDLAMAVRWSLQAAKVPLAQIELLAPCTACEPSAFFSHRRDKGLTGRQISVAVCRLK